MILALKVAQFAGISLVIYLAIALVLILSQWPKSPVATDKGLDFSREIKAAGPPPAGLSHVPMRDGLKLPVRLYPSVAAAAPLVVLVHGSGWHGLQFDTLARALQPLADVVVPDLRGHGQAPATRGDVGYIGQLEDDLADLITARRKPGQKVVLAGHSSGGGLVVRMAGGPHGQGIDAAVLLAPFLKYNAPTTRPNSGGWAHPLSRRIIGLSMLNMLRITALNHMTVIEFAFPAAVLDGPMGATATRAYSFALNTSYAPRGDYLADIARLPVFLLIAGTADEAFVADGYQPLMAGVNDKGTYRLIDGVSHLDVVNAPQTVVAFRAFLQALPDAGE